ncbi:hypothetical protein ABPG77_003926 [Micractinium sp. CCAP 211/92]
MLHLVLPALLEEPQQHRVNFTTRREVRPPDDWQNCRSRTRRSQEEPRPPGAAPLAAAAVATSAAAWLPGPASAGRSASAAAASSPLSFELGIGDLLVGHDSEIVRSARHAVHTVERLEQRLQRQAAELPAGVRRLLAGGVAGAAGKTSTAPLEAVKMQLVQSGDMTAWQATQVLWRRGGVAAFFRGNSVDVLRTIPSRAIELSCYEWYKRVLRRWNRRNDTELRVPDKLVATLAGGLAGVTASVAVYPMETARTRMALGTAHGHFLGAVAHIAGREGVGALFRGLDASLVGVVPYAAIRLGTYDGLKALWRRSTGRKDIDPQAALLFGAVAGVLSASLTYPLEVARRRMMAGAPHPNVAAALATIARTEGPGALFNGVLLSAVIKQAPQMAITFATYEMAKHVLALH